MSDLNDRTTAITGLIQTYKKLFPEDDVIIIGLNADIRSIVTASTLREDLLTLTLDVILDERRNND